VTGHYAPIAAPETVMSTDGHITDGKRSFAPHRSL